MVILVSLSTPRYREDVTTDVTIEVNATALVFLFCFTLAMLIPLDSTPPPPHTHTHTSPPPPQLTSANQCSSLYHKTTLFCTAVEMCVYIHQSGHHTDVADW